MTLESSGTIHPQCFPRDFFKCGMYSIVIWDAISMLHNFHAGNESIFSFAIRLTLRWRLGVSSHRIPRLAHDLEQRVPTNGLQAQTQGRDS